MIKVRYFYSACVGIETQETSILCDPWFTDGAYEGSWHQYPKLENPLEKIPAYEYVYVSHIHPDHYDPVFLRAYLEKHPQAKVIIANFKYNFLAKKMTADGFTYEIVERMKKGATELNILLNGHTENDIDSVLVVTREAHSVVNMNDALTFNPDLVAEVKKIAPNPTIALIAYTGAGPYPQTYITDKELCLKKAAIKKQQFFDKYKLLANALNAKKVIPFAGKYIFGGYLTPMIEYTGNADAFEVTKFDPRAVILADGGDAVIDTETLQPSAVRDRPYDIETLRAYLPKISGNLMHFEQYFKDLPPRIIQFPRLFRHAYANAQAHSTVEMDYFLCVKFGENKWFVMNTKMGSNFFTYVGEEKLKEFSPRNEIYIDPRYLYGLLTCVFHWNNAEGGSMFQTRRTPDEFHRSVQNFLSFFHV